MDHRGRGFTLLEVIVALTIFGLMAGIIFTSLRMVADIYDRSQENLVRQATQRALFEHIRRQLGSLYPLRPAAGFVMQEGPFQDPANPIAQIAQSRIPLFHGESGFVVFVTVAPLILHENPGLTVVRYGLAETDDGAYSYLGAMERRYTGQGSFIGMIESPPGNPLPLVESVDHLSFEYYGYDPELQDYAWYSNWLGTETMVTPLAIKIAYDDKYVLVGINADGMATGAAERVLGILGQ